MRERERERRNNDFVCVYTNQTPCISLETILCVHFELRCYSYTTKSTTHKRNERKKQKQKRVWENNNINTTALNQLNEKSRSYIFLRFHLLFGNHCLGFSKMTVLHYIYIILYTYRWVYTNVHILQLAVYMTRKPFATLCVYALCLIQFIREYLFCVCVYSVIWLASAHQEYGVGWMFADVAEGVVIRCDRTINHLKNIKQHDDLPMFWSMECCG